MDKTYDYMTFAKDVESKRYGYDKLTKKQYAARQKAKDLKNRCSVDGCKNTHSVWREGKFYCVQHSK